MNWECPQPRGKPKSHNSTAVAETAFVLAGQQQPPPKFHSTGGISMFSSRMDVSGMASKHSQWALEFSFLSQFGRSLGGSPFWYFNIGKPSCWMGKSSNFLWAMASIANLTKYQAVISSHSNHSILTRSRYIYTYIYIFIYYIYMYHCLPHWTA